MSSNSETNVRLTSAERNSIIQNESRGIYHPLYYVCQTKSGKVQVRKRKTPLVNGGITSTAPTLTVNGVGSSMSVQPQQAPQATVDYNSVTNRELLERMLDVLQKNVHSNDEDKNSVENEHITQENQQFIDNIVKANAKLYDSNEPVKTAQVVQPTRVVRRGRVLI